MVGGERPECPRGCRRGVHRHGSYHRYASAEGSAQFRVQRFWCPECELTISVLPADRLPYRPVEGARLEAYFNEQAEIGTGPDPPPAVLEAGCLRRAWARFQTRGSILKEAFGLLIGPVSDSARVLWKQLRLAKGTLREILRYLMQTHKCSLLGEYACLRVPD